MDENAKDIENRLTRLETRVCHIHEVMTDRRLVIAAHSRRLADTEARIHDLTRIQIDNIGKLTETSEQLSTITRERRDERMRRDARQAVIQWGVSVAMGIGIVVGLFTRGETHLIQTILSGFGWHPG